VRHARRFAIDVGCDRPGLDGLSPPGACDSKYSQDQQRGSHRYPPVEECENSRKSAHGLQGAQRAGE
jgi:hypothetical protein